MQIDKGKIRKILYKTVIVISTILIIAAILSLVYDIPMWYLMILDFPRVPQMVLGLLFLGFFILLKKDKKKWNNASIALVSGLVATVLIHFYMVYPYWLGDKVVADAPTELIKEDETVSMLISNVLITNKESGGFLKVVAETDPDMVLAMETNQWWADAIAELGEKYPHSMIKPKENGYGLILYSKLPLNNRKVHHHNHSEVPSFEVDITLPSGKEFKFFGVHPVAPFPSKKYPTNIGSITAVDQKEAVELERVGDMVKGIKDVPVIVAGDFNDVAWARTSRVFGDSSGLKDVRIGRGMHNTFNAHTPFLKWPLDHYYVTDGISVIAFECKDNFKSDHHPLYAEFLIGDRNNPIKPKDD